jgi:glutathione S-transferase
MLIVLLQLWMMMRVARWRGRSGIKAPAMTGDPALERAIRVHMNTVEQLAMFLPALLVCAAYSGDRCTASIAALWLVGRVMYAIGYVAVRPPPSMRSRLGFARRRSPASSSATGFRYPD